MVVTPSKGETASLPLSSDHLDQRWEGPSPSGTGTERIPPEPRFMSHFTQPKVRRKMAKSRATRMAWRGRKMGDVMAAACMCEQRGGVSKGMEGE